MGFTTGFTGGLTLTLSVAYLTVLAHQRNRQRQGEALRTSALILESLAAGPGAQPPLPAGPTTREELVALRRANLTETFKDRWNAEVEGAVHWVQETDWAEVREGLEAAAGRLWRRAFGGEPGEQVDAAAAAARDEVAAASASVAGAARTKAAEARASVSAAAKSALEEAKVKGSQASAAVEGKAREAKAAAQGVIERGVEKGREASAKAQAAVELAEQKAEADVSEVERALQQRFQPSNVMDKKVDELLSERYKPLDQRDNTVLRGI